MKLTTQKGLLIFVLTLLASCSAIKDDTMTPSSGPVIQGTKPIVLREAYTFPTKQIIGKTTITIAQGTYVPIAGDGNGMYYIGPKDCLLTQGSLMVAYTSHCGLYIEKESPEKIYFFSFDSGYETSKDPFWNIEELRKYKNNHFEINTEYPILKEKLNAVGL